MTVTTDGCHVGLAQKWPLVVKAGVCRLFWVLVAWCCLGSRENGEKPLQ